MRPRQVWVLLADVAPLRRPFAPSAPCLSLVQIKIIMLPLSESGTFKHVPLGCVLDWHKA